MNLLPCPFCGRRPSTDLIDTLYPVATEWYETGGGYRGYTGRKQAATKAQGRAWGNCWQMCCSPSEGGCGVEVYGDSREEAIAAWNRRPPKPQCPLHDSRPGQWKGVPTLCPVCDNDFRACPLFTAKG
jgi:hypothetical protein